MDADKTIAFEKVQTFGELKMLLPRTEGCQIPRIETLIATAKIVLRGKTSQGIILVFDNGFYCCTEEGRATVYGVDRCTRLTWRFCNDESKTVEGKDVENLPWAMPLEIAAANRLDNNKEGAQRKKVVISLDSPESKNNPLFSVRPMNELVEIKQVEEFNRWWRNRQVQLALEKEKPQHRRMISMYGYDGKTQKEIAAEMGVSQQAVQQIIDRFRDRLRKRGVICK